MRNGHRAAIRTVARAGAEWDVDPDLYPDGWLERQEALENGSAQPRDYWAAFQESLRTCKHGRRILDGCTVCDYESRPRWVTRYENGVLVMAWFDPFDPNGCLPSDHNVHS